MRSRHRVHAAELPWRGGALPRAVEDRSAVELRRLPDAATDAVADDQFLTQVRTPAGAHLAVSTEASLLELEIWISEPASSLDIVVDGSIWERVALAAGWQTARIPLPGRRVDLVVALPVDTPTRLGTLAFVGDQDPVPTVESGPRWLTYGSSITQGIGASGPSDAWPWRVAASQGWRHTNLGLAGQCHLDPAVADHLRATPADLISLCVGINIYGKRTFSARSLGPAMTGFVRRVREGHPTTPLVVVTPIACPDRESTPNADGLTLRDIRSIVAAATTRAAELDGVPVTIVDGLDILNENEAQLLPDRLHPNSEGYELMARRLAPRLADALGGAAR